MTRPLPDISRDLGHDPVIVDTCVLIAGLPTAAGPGPWAGLVEGMRAGSMVFVASEALLREYRAVLARPAIADRLRLGGEGLVGLLDDLSRHARRLEPAASDTHGRRAPDPGDTHLWALLGADERLRLLTLDRQLLAHSRMRRRVITPHAWHREQVATRHGCALSVATLRAVDPPSAPLR